MAAKRAGMRAILILAALACACASGPTPSSPTVTPTNPSTLPPRPTATPSFSGELLDLAVLPGTHEGQVQVIGLLQAVSDIRVEDVQLQVKLSAADGRDLDEVVVPLLLNRLAPGDTSPFTATFDATPSGAVASIEVITFHQTSFVPGDLDVGPPDTWPLEDGGLALSGLVSNQGTAPVELRGLVFVGVDEDARLEALAIQSSGLTFLDAGQSAPYLARAANASEVFRWIPFHDAIVVEAPEPHAISFAEQPTIRVTAQGRPFVIGSLRNDGAESRSVSVLLILKSGDQILALGQVETEVPIAAGETLPFAHIDFPGLSLRTAELAIEPDQLQVEAVIDPGASAPSPDHRVALDLQVEAFDFTGSTIFLRGTVTNPEAVTVAAPTLYASVRQLSGELVTAGWARLAGRLPSAGSLDFVFDMPLPAGAEPPSLEFDVRALALGP